MPRLSGYFVRASLVYLAAGFTLGALLLLNKAVKVYPPVWVTLPIHIEILLLGWFVQLALGVAYWILPRLSGNSPRGNAKLAWLAFGLVNLGIILVILQAFTSFQPLLLLGRLAELMGVVSFVAASWKRVKSFAR